MKGRENGMKQKPDMRREKRHETKAKCEGKGKTAKYVGKKGMKQKRYEEKNSIKQKPNMKEREKRHETKAKQEGNKSNRVRQSDAILGVIVLSMIALLFILQVVVTLKICLNSITSM